MALEKQSLNNFLPDGFETEDKDGYKTNFSDDKISTGFQKDVADILSGPNLNNLIDKVGKNTNTTNNYIIKNMTFADSIKIKRVAPMMLDITLKGANIIQTPTFRDDIERVLGQGVGINNLIVLGA